MSLKLLALMGCFVLVVILLALYFFLFSVQTTVFPPKIILEENEGCPGSDNVTLLQSISFTSVKGFLISYYGLEFRIDKCQFPTNEHASQYINLVYLPVIEKYGKTDFSLDGLDGYRYHAKDRSGILLRNNTVVLNCVGYTGDFEKTKYVCEWFLKEYRL